MLNLHPTYTEIARKAAADVARSYRNEARTLPAHAARYQRICLDAARRVVSTSQMRYPRYPRR